MRSPLARTGWLAASALLLLAASGCHTNQPVAASTSATTTPPPPMYLSTLHCVEQYNSTHPGTLEAMNNSTDHYGAKFQFFAPDGKPNIDVLTMDYDPFDAAFQHVIPLDFREQCLKDQRSQGYY